MDFYKLPHNIQTCINSFDSDFMVKKFLIYQTKFYSSINKNNQRKLKKFYSKKNNYNKQLKKGSTKKNYQKYIERHLSEKNYQTQFIRLCRENILFHCKHTQVIIESDHDYHKPRYEYKCKCCLQTLDKKLLWRDKIIKREYKYI